MPAPPPQKQWYDTWHLGHQPDKYPLTYSLRKGLTGIMNGFGNMSLGPLPELQGSPEYSPFLNSLIGITNMATEPDRAINRFGGKVYDFMFTPEAEQEARAQEEAGPQAKIDPARIKSMFGPRARGSTTPLVEYDEPQAPLPPTATAFQQGAPPQPGAIPLPPTMEAPDFSSFDKYLEEAAPTRTDRDWDGLRRKMAWAGLAKGAAEGGEWYNILANAGAGAGAAGVDFEEKQYEDEDEFNKAMQRYNLTRADASLQKSKMQTDVKNENAERQYRYQSDIRERDDKYATDKYNVDQGNLERAHQAGVENARRMYEYNVDKANRQAGKVLNITKDGVVMQTVKDGKVKIEHRAINRGTADTQELRDLKLSVGEDSPLYKQVYYQALMEGGDDVAVRQEMAMEAVEKGYAKDVFGETYDEAAKAATEQLTASGILPGTKEFAENYPIFVSNYIMDQVDLTSPEQMWRFYQRGNEGAGYFLQAIETQ